MDLGTHRGPRTGPLWIPRGDCIFLANYILAKILNVNNIHIDDNKAITNLDCGQGSYLTDTLVLLLC